MRHEIVSQPDENQEPVVRWKPYVGADGAFRLAVAGPNGHTCHVLTVYTDGKRAAHAFIPASLGIELGKDGIMFDVAD